MERTTALLYLPVEEDAVEGLAEIHGVVYNKMVVHNGHRTAEFTLSAGGYDFNIENNGKLAVAYKP